MSKTVRGRPGGVVGDARGTCSAEGGVCCGVLEVEAFGEDGVVAGGGKGSGARAVHGGGEDEGGDVSHLEEAGADLGEVFWASKAGPWWIRGAGPAGVVRSIGA